MEGIVLAAAYGAAKGGVSALSRGIAAELAARGIRCNTIVPGRIVLPVKGEERIPVTIDLGILGRGKTILGNPPMARIAAMVASDDGAHSNGTEIRIDGGWVAPLDQFGDRQHLLGAPPSAPDPGYIP